MSGVIKLGNITLGTENSGKVDLTNVGATSADSVTATNLTGTVTNLPSSLTALDTSASNGATSNADNTALPLFGCRAFVNFNGTSYTSVGGENHCAIRASGNVSKVVRTGQGTYTITFTTAMPDVNYSCVATGGKSGNRGNSINVTNMAVDLVELSDGIDHVYYDSTYVNVAVFR